MDILGGGTFELGSTITFFVSGHGFNVPHPVDLVNTPTHITLDRQLISTKAGGLVYHTWPNSTK